MEEIYVIEEVVETIEIIERGEQGPPGSGGSTALTMTAGAALSGRRMVVTNSSGHAIYADQTMIDHAHRVLGITTGAAALGAAVIVQTSGEFTESTWNWNIDHPIFLGINGQLTQTVPATGVLLQVAAPMSTTTILIGTKMPYIHS